MKKACVLLTTVLLVAALAAGCGGQATTAATSAPPAATTAATTAATNESAAPADTGSSSGVASSLSNDPVTMSCLIADFVNAPTTDDQLFWKGLKDRFNITMHMEVVDAADFSTRMNLSLSSNDIPNFINAGSTELTKYYNTGALVDLAPVLKQYGQDYLAEINKDPIVLKNCKDDQGRMFFFTRLYWDYEYLYLSMNIGQLTKLGGKMPTTTDEFFEALKTIHNANPDEYFTRGQWNAGAHSLQIPIYLAYGTYNNWIHFKDGEYVFGPYERKDEMKKALTFLHQMYAAGVIDPEFLTIDQDTYTAKFTAGKVAAVFGWLGGANMWPTDENGLNKPDSAYDWKVVPALKGPDGYQYSLRMNMVDEVLYVTKSCPDVPRAVNMFNWLYTPEGIEYENWGVEGVTYTKTADGKKDLTEEVKKDKLGMMNGMRARGFYPAIFSAFVSDFDFYKYLVPETMVIGIEGNRPYRIANNPVLTPTDAENNQTAQLGTDIMSVIDEKLPKFVTGELNIDTDYDAYIAQLEQIGVKDYMKVIKDEYSRWQAR